MLKARIKRHAVELIKTFLRRWKFSNLSKRVPEQLPISITSFISGQDARGRVLVTRGRLIVAPDTTWRMSFEKMMSELNEKNATGQVHEEVLMGKVLDFLTSDASVEIRPEEAVNG